MAQIEACAGLGVDLKRKMRIIHVAYYFYPSLGYQEAHLARAQSKLGHEVYIVTSDRYAPLIYSKNKGLLGSRIKGVGFFIEEGIKVWRLKTLFEMPHQIWVLGLEKKIQELKPDLVIVHGIVNFAALRIARLKKQQGNFKLIYDDHMTFDNSGSKMKIFYPLFRWFFSPLIQKAADVLVAILPETKVFMHRRYGIPLDRVVIIPLGADDNLFNFDTASRREIRSQLSLNESDVVFIYTGKIIPEKRLDLLIEAAARLAEEYSCVKVMLVGDGSQTYIDGLRKHIRTNNLEGKIVWHDALPNKELPKFYCAADVAVWPRGASISQREAMACNLPIIISEGSMVTELVDYNNGLICREGDVAHLAQQMEKLLDPQLRKEMGSNGRKYVEEKLSWRIIARQFIGLVCPLSSRVQAEAEEHV